MAFRSHEINLMLRVQDRASSRLRRVANDLGGINRVAQMQNDMNRVASQSTTRLGRIEQQTSLNRLRGMSAANAEAEHFYNTLDSISKVKGGPLSAAETATIARNYERAASAAGMMRTGRNLVHAGGAAAVVGGAGLVAAGAAAGSYAEFNRESIKTATQLRGVGEGFATTNALGKQLESTILGMSRRFPASMTEMAESSYELASGLNLVDAAGRPLRNGQERLAATTNLLTIANKAAVAGGVDLKESTEAMILVLNNFGGRLDGTQASTDRVNSVMNTLFSTVRYGKGTFAEFSPVFGRMAATANAAGQSLTEAGGAVAFLSTRMSQSQAVTAYIRLMQILQRPEAVAGFKALTGLNITVPGTDKLRPLSEIINILTKGGTSDITKGGLRLSNIIAEMTAAGQKALGSQSKDPKGLQSTQNARQGIQFLIHDWKDYIDILNNVTSNQNEFDQAYAAARTAPGVKWQIAMNQFKAFGIIIGQDVIPVILRLMDTVRGLMDRWRAISASTRGLITRFGAWLAILLLVGGAVSVITGGILGLIGRLTLLTAEAGAATTASARLLVVLKALQRLALLGIAIGITYYITNKSFREKTQETFTKLDQKIIKDANKQRHTVGGFLHRAFHSPIEVVARLDLKFRGAALERARMAKIVADAAKNKIPYIGEDVSRGITRTNQETADKVLDTWKELASNLNGLDIYNALTRKTAEAATDISLALSKAQSEGDTAGTKKALQDQIAEYDRLEAPLEKLYRQGKLTAQQSKYLQQLWDAETAAKAKLTSMNTKETASQTKANKAKEVAATRLENAKQKMESLKLSMKNLREQELSKIETMFGNIFQGSVIGGPLGQIFTQINSTLGGFGIKPLPVPIDLILQDQKFQQDTFDTLSKDLTKVSGMLPKNIRENFIEQVKGMGADAVPFLEGVLNASSGKRAKFIQGLIKRQGSIDNAMDSPWEKLVHASDLQYQAAVLQYKAAGGKLTKAQQNAVSAGKPKVTPKPTSVTGGTRTLAGHTTVHHGDTVTIHADGATPGAVNAAFNKHAFNKKYTRKY